MTRELSLNSDRCRIAQKLADALGDGKYEMWFQSARVEADAEALNVAVPTRFVADWIEGHFHEQLQALAAAELGPAAKVRLHVDPACGSVSERRIAPAGPHRTTETAAAVPVPAAPPPRPRHIPLRHTLDDFIVGSSNELAFTAACRMVDEAQVTMNPLFIHGSCGLGKTHLLQGLCQRYAQQHPTGRWCYTSAEQFTNQYVMAVQKNRLGELRRRLRGLDLLAVDDVHFFSSKSATQTEFLHTFDAMDLQGARLILASDAHPKMIQQFSQALVSRFMSGMVVKVEAPERNLRRRILAALAQRRGMTIIDEALDLLADHPTGSVREMEGLLARLAAMAAVRETAIRHRPIGASLVHRLLEPDDLRLNRRPVRVEQIIDVVCREMGVERTLLMDRGRHRRVVLARSVAIYLARQMTTLSYPELAKALHRPNHSTIVTAHKRLAEQVAAQTPLTEADGVTDARLDQLVDRLRRAVLQSAPAA